MAMVTCKSNVHLRDEDEAESDDVVRTRYTHLWIQ